MIVTALDHYAIRAYVDTVDACVAFYTSMLNLRIGFRPPFAILGFWLHAGDQPLIHLRKDHLTSVIELLCKPLKPSTETTGYCLLSTISPPLCPIRRLVSFAAIGCVLAVQNRCAVQLILPGEIERACCLSIHRSPFFGLIRFQ